MSYHYHINQPIIIVDENLMNLKRKFEIYSLMGLSAKLAENGYHTLPETFAPDELTEFVDRELGGWEYMDGLSFSNVGWTPEYQGLKGIVERFTEFVKFVGYNIPHRDYTITDDYENKITVRVTGSDCSVIDV